MVLRKTADNVLRLMVFDEATGRTSVFRELPKGSRIDNVSTALSVSPDGRWIAYTVYEQSGSNLMLMDGFR